MSNYLIEKISSLRDLVNFFASQPQTIYQS